jgi:hypothetical protein
VSTRLTGNVSITCLEVKIQLAADSARFVLTLNADPGNVWRYNLSEASHNARNSRVAFGRIIAPDCRAALRQIAAVLGQGYEPGTVERGLFDMVAAGPPDLRPLLMPAVAPRRYRDAER